MLLLWSSSPCNSYLKLEIAPESPTLSTITSCKLSMILGVLLRRQWGKCQSLETVYKSYLLSLWSFSSSSMPLMSIQGSAKGWVSANSNLRQNFPMKTLMREKGSFRRPGQIYRWRFSTATARTCLSSEATNPKYCLEYIVSRAGVQRHCRRIKRILHLINATFSKDTSMSFEIWKKWPKFLTCDLDA